jgi:hypothetical protein
MSAPTVSATLFKLGTGLFLMLAGLTGTALLFIPWRRAMETRSWTETPCVIVESRIDQERMSEFAEPVARVFLKYRYTFGGREFTGTKWRRVSFFSSEDRDVARKTPHFEEARKLVAKYPAGAAVKCRVNPAAPDEAVLEHQTKAAIYTLWWPMLFAVGGGGMVWSALRGRRKRADAH